MPIDIDLLQNDDGVELIPIQEETNKWEVLKFLINHPDKAFTRSELEEATDVTRNSMGSVLTRLKAAGLVRHNSGFWTIRSDDRVEALEARIRSARMFAVRSEPEDFSDWRESSVENPGTGSE